MSNSTVVPSSEYGVTQYQPLATAPGSNGGIYSSGFVTGQNSAASQHALINATKGGKKRHFKGGDGQIVRQFWALAVLNTAPGEIDDASILGRMKSEFRFQEGSIAEATREGVRGNLIDTGFLQLIRDNDRKRGALRKSLVVKLWNHTHGASRPDTNLPRR